MVGDRRVGAGDDRDSENEDQGPEPQTPDQAGPGRVRAGFGALGKRVGRVGRAFGTQAGRVWSGLTAGRARRAEARMEAAREAARARAAEVAGVPLSPKPERPAEFSGVSVSTGGNPEADEKEGHDESDEPDEPEPPEGLGQSDEVEETEDVEEVGEAEPRGDDTSPAPSTEDRSIKAGARLVGVMRHSGGTVATGVKKAGAVLGSTSKGISKKGAIAGRSAWAGLRRMGRGVGPAVAAMGGGIQSVGRAAWVELRWAGRVTLSGIRGMGKALLWVGAGALAGLVQVAKVTRDLLRRWVERVRRTWVARPPRPRTLISIGAGLVVVLGYVLAQVSVASRVAPGTTMLGVGVGGLPVDEAQELLEGRLEELSSSVVTISVDGRSVVMTPEELGLGIDTEATFDLLAGFSWSPLTLWRQAVGVGEVRPVVTVDEAQFREAVEEAVDTLNQDQSDAEVVLGPTGAIVRASQDEVVVDADVLAETVLESWPSDSPIVVPADITEPGLLTSEATRFAQTFNDVVLASPVTLNSPNGSVVFTPEDLITFGSIVAEDSHYSFVLDGEALADVVNERLPGVENAPVNAAFAFDSNHQLYIVPGTPGRVLDVDELGNAIASAATGITRDGEIPLDEADPEVTTEDLENSDFQVRVSTYYTEFTPREPSREHNIANAASKIVGYVVEPGEEFSITEAIGPITRANGYVSAGVIVGGVHTNGIGGGLCQIATTSYVAAYMAGYEILERSPHTEWFSRYPAGRDAAIATGTDMRFRNDTPYAMMFNAYLDGPGLRVDIWSTPYYTVEASSSGKYDVTGGGYKTSTETPCHPSAPKSGFTITDTRKVFLDGELLRTETRVSRYRAVAGTQCV